MTHIIKTNCDKSHQTPAFPRVDRGRALPERVLAGGGTRWRGQAGQPGRDLRAPSLGRPPARSPGQPPPARVRRDLTGSCANSLHTSRVPSQVTDAARKPK